MPSNEISYLKTRFKIENLMFENFLSLKTVLPKKNIFLIYITIQADTQSTTQKKNPYWMIQRPDSGNVISSIEIPGITLDQLCKIMHSNPFFKSRC